MVEVSPTGRRLEWNGEELKTRGSSKSWVA
jgi:hypothetical protein